MAWGWHGYRILWHLLMYNVYVICTTERALVTVPLHRSPIGNRFALKKSVTAILRRPTCQNRFTGSLEGNCIIERVGMRVPRVTTDGHGGRD